MTAEASHPPIPNSYRLPGLPLAAGEYPGAKPDPGDAGARAKLAHFLDAGITAFIDLTATNDPLAPYDATLAAMAEELGLDVHYERLTIRDMGTCEPAHMTRILDAIATRLAEGRSVYVHCWGGVGRTGTVIGCWLVRQGASGEDALRQVQSHFETMHKSRALGRHPEGSPQTDAQRAMVRDWQRHEQGDQPTSRAGEGTT